MRRRHSAGPFDRGGKPRDGGATVKSGEPGPTVLGKSGEGAEAPLLGSAAAAGRSATTPLASGQAACLHSVPVHLLHPLTLEERQALSHQIEQEVTANAIELLHQDQDYESRLNVVHVKCISLLLLAAVAVGACMVYLRVVLVPLVLAVFFMFLLEPLLFTLLEPPAFVKRVCPKMLHGLFSKIYGPPPADADSTPRENLPRRWGDGSPGGMTEASSVASTGVMNCRSCGDSGRLMLQQLLARTWTFIAVLASMAALSGAFFLMAYFSVQAISNFPWQTYRASPKMRLVLKWFPQLGTDPEELKIDAMIPWLLQGPLFNAIDVTFSIITQGFLTLLFLAFLLANDASAATSEDVPVISHKIRGTVRRYIRIKTCMSVLVSVSTGILYWLWNVDLFFLFALITFILYYIPHVGNTVAILAPLPVVFLDPAKTIGDLVFLFVMPFIIHQLATNLVDPKLLASSLDLHPITVLLSLAFWTTVWGPVGAVLSVPLTAVVRLLLLEMNHPYTGPIVKILKGEVRDLRGTLSPVPGQSTYGGSEGDESPPRSPRSPRSPKPRKVKETATEWPVVPSSKNTTGQEEKDCLQKHQAEMDLRRGDGSCPRCGHWLGCLTPQVLRL